MSGWQIAFAAAAIVIGWLVWCGVLGGLVLAMGDIARDTEFDRNGIQKPRKR